ncbi:patched domain-containing protein 3-like [Littorina saxatilis]|uniref:SSD domain-containing protein n=1 Tax=Littorina saxatilis TaxID=31220 RepID=A0AAN9BFD3_9CAEN
MQKKRRLVFQIDNLYICVKDKVSETFYKFGVLVGRHPVWFSVVPLIVCLGLGCGILAINENVDTEKLFTPQDSRIYSDRQRLRDNFPDSTSWNFDAFGLSEVPTMAVLLFRRGGKDKVKTNTFETADVDIDQQQYNIFEEKVMDVIRGVIKKVEAIQIKNGGKTYTVLDICARSQDQCVFNGKSITSPSFKERVDNGTVPYPNYRDENGPSDLSFNLAGVKASATGVLVAARVLKVRFFWRVDQKKIAKLWNIKFLELVSTLDKEGLPYDVTIAYSTSESLEHELLEGTSGDAIYFGLTILLMSSYSILVSTGGDVVSTRALLACGGVLAAFLGIVASLGLLSLCGTEYVNFVGIMPYLVLGIGVDDMFLMMSAWGESFQYNVGTPERLGLTFSKAGVGITITSVTDFLAFLIGISSSFLAVKLFCLFTAFAVLAVYIVNCTLFGACLSLHGDRVFAGKHCLTCRPTQSRQYFRNQKANCCKVYCCGGSVPTKNFEDESICEKLPRYILPRLILNPIVKVIILMAFLSYLGAAVYGAIQLKPGMKYVDLVLRSSYYYKYSTWEQEYYGERLAIAFVVDKEINYGAEEGDRFREVLNEAQRDPLMNSKFLRCWLHQFSRSPFYPNTSEAAADKVQFTQGLLQYLKLMDKLSLNDVKFDATNTSVLASRCFVLTKNDVSIFKQADMMIRMRELTDGVKEYTMFVFQPVFIMLEHTIAILPSTLQTIGTAVAVMFLVTAAMLPQLLMVSLVTLNIIFIITCVFGFMYFLDLTFSGISMIHILMSVGFSVDFSAHICAAYLMSDDTHREDRARYALVHASGPIFNGGMSSLVGVSMLMLSESYFFISFFKIMSMVIVAGAVNSVFFMPIVLSWIGPENPDQGSRRDSSCIPQLPPNVEILDREVEKSAQEEEQEEKKGPKEDASGSTGNAKGDAGSNSADAGRGKKNRVDVEEGEPEQHDDFQPESNDSAVETGLTSPRKQSSGSAPRS